MLLAKGAVPNMLSNDLIELILSALPGKTVGVIGDLFLDRYLDIDDSRTEPSIETGLDAYQVVSVRSYPGAAGTVINNLVSLGISAIYAVTVIGDDGEGYELQQALRRIPALNTESVLIRKDIRTPTYTKPMLMKNGQPPRELNRLDIKNGRSLNAAGDIIHGINTVW